MQDMPVISAENLISAGKVKLELTDPWETHPDVKYSSHNVRIDLWNYSDFWRAVNTGFIITMNNNSPIPNLSTLFMVVDVNKKYPNPFIVWLKYLVKNYVKLPGPIVSVAWGYMAPQTTNPDLRWKTCLQFIDARNHMGYIPQSIIRDDCLLTPYESRNDEITYYVDSSKNTARAELVLSYGLPVDYTGQNNIQIELMK